MVEVNGACKYGRDRCKRIQLKSLHAMSSIKWQTDGWPVGQSAKQDYLHRSICNSSESKTCLCKTIMTKSCLFLHKRSHGHTSKKSHTKSIHYTVHYSSLQCHNRLKGISQLWRNSEIQLTQHKDCAYTLLITHVSTYSPARFPTDSDCS